MLLTLHLTGSIRIRHTVYYWLTKESTFSLLQMTKLQEWLTGLVMVLAVWLALLSGDGGQLLCIFSRAVDPHSFFVDPDPAAFFLMSTGTVSGSCFKKIPYEEFSIVEKRLKRLLKIEKPWSCSNSLHFFCCYFSTFTSWIHRLDL